MIVSIAVDAQIFHGTDLLAMSTGSSHSQWPSLFSHVLQVNQGVAAEGCEIMMFFGRVPSPPLPTTVGVGAVPMVAGGPDSEFEARLSSA